MDAAEKPPRASPRASGPTAIARRVVEMVAALHARGYPSLGIEGLMAPSGMAWRYRIGVIPTSGVWGPNGLDPLIARGSLGARLEWADANAGVATLANAFVAAHGDPLDGARHPNDAYVAWLRETLSQIPVSHVFSFASDYNDYERVAVVGSGPPLQLSIPYPPGFRV